VLGGSDVHRTFSGGRALAVWWSAGRVAIPKAARWRWDEGDVLHAYKQCRVRRRAHAPYLGATPTQ
jgi:hypothetical protein